MVSIGRRDQRSLETRLTAPPYDLQSRPLFGSVSNHRLAIVYQVSASMGRTPSAWWAAIAASRMRSAASYVG